MIDNSNGRRWARFWLVVALAVSTIANVTHAVLATSDISLWLRVPGAMVWPIFTFAGIEILVRMIWQKSRPHTVTQWVLLSAAVPAAITSYEHQYTLLGMMGERWIIQCIGPVAIDGLMIGCTMALLFTRTMPTIEAATAPALMEYKTRDEIALSDEQVNDQLAAYSLADLTSPAPVSPAPVGVPAAPKAERAPRTGSAERAEKVRAMLEADLAYDTKDSTMRRYARLARILRDNPQAELDYKGVQRDIVETIIRPWAGLERVR